MIGPPEVPADRVAMLRVAFNMAVADPEFLKDATLQRLAIDPVVGDCGALLRDNPAVPSA